MNKAILILALLAVSAIAYDCSGLVAFTGDRGFSSGDVVAHNGRAYRSLRNDNWCDTITDTTYWLDLGACSNDACAGLAWWDYDTQYSAGQQVVYNGVIWQATKANSCQNPCQPSSPWQSVGTCYITCQNANTWDSTTVYYKNDIVKYGGYLYIAYYWTQGNRPDQNSGSWQQWKQIRKCQICVTVEKGDCLSVSSTGECRENPWQFTVTATPQSQNCLEGRVIQGATRSVWVSQDTTITFDCECKQCVTTTGDCVYTPTSACVYPSDHVTVSISVAAPVPDPGYECVIDFIQRNGANTAANPVVFVDVQGPHVVNADCRCYPIGCPYTNCLTTTQTWSSTVKYPDCSCVKYEFYDWDNGPKLNVVFCTEKASFCQDPENNFNWVLQEICNPQGLNCGNAQTWSAGEYKRGTVRRMSGALWVAKWTNTEQPGTGDAQWGAWRKLRNC